MSSLGSGNPFAEAENVPVRVVDVKLEAGPRLLLQRVDDSRSTLFQFAEQIADARDGDISIEMLVLFAVFSLRGKLRGALKMDGEPVAADARVERFVSKIELEAKLLTVVRDCAVKVVDEKLGAIPVSCVERSTAVVDTSLPPITGAPGALEFTMQQNVRHSTATGAGLLPARTDWEAALRGFGNNVVCR